MSAAAAERASHQIRDFRDQRPLQFQVVLVFTFLTSSNTVVVGQDQWRYQNTELAVGAAVRNKLVTEITRNGER